MYTHMQLNGAVATGSTTMIATLKFLSRIADNVFESQMQRAAQKICERQYYFGRLA
jgi:hypothetical protein